MNNKDMKDLWEIERQRAAVEKKAEVKQITDIVLSLLRDRIDSGDPPQLGLYVIFLHHDGLSNARRVLAFWDNGAWYDQFSAQKVRGEVMGWIGPLPEMSTKNEIH